MTNPAPKKSGRQRSADLDSYPPGREVVAVGVEWHAAQWQPGSHGCRQGEVPQMQLFRCHMGLIALLGMALMAPAHATPREVRVGVYPNAPKIFLGKNGQVSGILGDLLTEIARRQGWTLKPVPCEWQGCLDALQHERIDLLPDLAFSEQRADKFSFHKIPALYSWSAIFVRDGTTARSMLDLKGMRIAVVKDSIQVSYLHDLLAGFGIQASLMPVRSLDEGFAQVAAGKCDAVAANNFFGEANAQRYRLVESPIMFQPVQLFYGTARGKNADLLDAIDQQLRIWVAQPDSIYFTVLKKWYGQTTHAVVPAWLFRSLGIAATLLLLALLVSAYLRHQVIEKTRHLQAGREELAQSELTLRTIVNSVGAIIYRKDTAGIYTFANEQTLRYLQIDMEDIIGFDDGKLFDPATAANIRRNDLRVLVNGETLTTEDTNTSANTGETSTYLSTKLPLRDEHGNIHALCGISWDITEHKQTEASLRIAATAFESQESMLITDADGIVLRVNKAFCENTGYAPEDVIGQPSRLLDSDLHGADFFARIRESLQHVGTWHGEVRVRRKNGEAFPKWLTISAVRGGDGVVTHYVESGIDITERKAAEEKIQHLAFYDPLTHLPNRRLLLDRLKQALVSSERNRSEGALLLIDLDNFKTLNDTLGHDIGDMLLQQVAMRLKSCTGEGDTVARLGGDEFVVMLPGLSGQSIEAATQTEMIGEKILHSLRQTYQLDLHTHHCSTSIGVSVFNGLQQSAEELLKQADIAMYQAKKAGRNALRFFDMHMQESISARASLESELRAALTGEQFRLHYQSQVDVSCRASGAEALIRWMHPERGMITPAEFIPLAEETGLILKIGKWVLDTACARLSEWRHDALTRHLTLAVNVSARQFHQPDFVAQVQAAVSRHAINPGLLKLELTESMLLDNIGETIATMKALHDVGVRFSLDDFGTGYSSLQYLKRLPLDQIKIDQSFVRDIAAGGSDSAIVVTIIAMASSLGIEVIAEGVETELQRKFLLENGCSSYQGFLFSRPMPIELFEASLRQPRNAASLTIS
jgi:diguanylate cyclase (GGDEF)-like protein/PAS domain S-box-containing protein